jgi:hypothetical protein
VEDVSPRNRSPTGAAQESASNSGEPDRGAAAASDQRLPGEPLELESDAAEDGAAFPWWHAAEVPAPRTDDGWGVDEPEQVEEPSFEPLATWPAGVPHPRRSAALKPLPSDVLTAIPDAPPPARLRRHVGSSPEAPSQPRLAAAESAPRQLVPGPGDDILILDTPVAPGPSPELPFRTLRAVAIVGAAPVPALALASAAARPARTFWLRAVSAILASIVLCSLGAIYAVGYLGLGADLKAALVRYAVLPGAATAGDSSRPASGGGAAGLAPPSAIVAIPPASVALDTATSPAVIAASSALTGSKAPDPPPFPETLAPPRPVADSPPLPPPAALSGVRPARPVYSTRASRPENRPPAVPSEPASTLPRPEDPADDAGRSALPASSASAVPPPPPPAILPVPETAPVRLARNADVSVAATPPPRLAADETAPPMPPPAAPLRQAPPAPAVPAPVAPPASEPSAPRLEALAPTVAPDPRPALARALLAAPALPADAQPAAQQRATAVEAAAAQIDPAILARRGRELLAAGEIAAARRFFERAAEAGNAPAATGAGRTYDPLYLRQAARGLRGDPEKAAEWYRKAVARGDGEAGILLMRLLAAQTP